MSDNSQNRIIWSHLGDEDTFWVLCYAEAGKHKIIIAEAARVIQEPYVEEGKHEDLLTVFTDTEAATLFIAALGKTIGAQHNESFRVVPMKADALMRFIGGLDKSYQSRQNAYLRVDVCELRGEDLHREILFSRQVPKH